MDEFAFMKPHRVATSTFNNLSIEAAKKLAQAFHFNLESVDEPGVSARDMFSAFSEHGILRRGEPVVHESTRDKITRAARPMGASATAVGPYTAEAISELAAEVAKLQHELEARIQKLEHQSQHRNSASAADDGG